MTRGNQREKARAKNQKEAAGKGVKNSKSGSEMLREKDKVNEIMRIKQEKALAKKAEDAAAAAKN